MFEFLSRSFSSFFSKLGRQKTLTPALVDDLLSTVRESLLQADVPIEAIEVFLASLKNDLVGAQVLPTLRADEFLMKTVHDRLLMFLGGKEDKGFFETIPATCMVMGLQGSGKTTTVAKLARFCADLLQKQKKRNRVLVASIDFYRPAAIDQLEVVAAQAGVAFYRASSVDVLAAVQEICAYRKKEDFDVLIIDTAGRLHVDEYMLNELVQVDKIIRSDCKLLVLDAMVGQESLQVARIFQERIGFCAAILTKMDSDTRGGAAFAFRYMLKKPILFVGTGERVADLERFYPDRMANRMLGLGDIVSLVERANDKIKMQEQDRLAQAMAKGRFTLDDFATQIDMINKLGSFGNVLKYLPGTAQLKISPEKLEDGEREMKRFRAIIGSMTKKERLMPAILDGARKKRVAKGAGVSVAEVNVLLERFQESQHMMKQLGKMGRFFK